jgi:glycosyltransferase involved in cell wall biosynthesis
MGPSRGAAPQLLKVAFFSPLPPERSGIADYSALLLPALQERLDVVVARRGRRPPRGTDVALYHVGNSPEAHGWIVDALQRRPGVVVLHDFVLHHLVAGLTIGRGQSRRYIEAMHQDAGVIGRLLAHGVVDHVLPPIWEERAQDYPLAWEVLKHAQAVICHSRYVERMARVYGYEGPIRVIPMPAWPAVEPGGRLLPEGRFPVIVCCGHLNAAKRIPQLLKAFERVRRAFPDALLVLAGSAARALRLDEVAAEDGILRLEYQAEEDLWRVLADCDVSVSLRWPTMGETSGIAIRTLSLGTPLVVSDAGWFAELPDSVAAKVPVDEYEVETLVAVLERLAADGGLRDRMAAAALEYVRREHDLDRAADRYVGTLEEAVGGPMVRDSVLGEVAVAAHEIGLRADDPELAEAAAELRGVGLGD